MRSLMRMRCLSGPGRFPWCRLTRALVGGLYDYLAFLWSDRQSWIDFAADMTVAHFDSEKSPAVQVTPFQITSTGDQAAARIHCHGGQGGHEKGGACGPQSPPSLSTRADHPPCEVPDAPAIDSLSQSPRSQHYRTLTSQSSFGSERRKFELSLGMCSVSYQGDVEEAKFLLALGASVNRIDEVMKRTPLQQAMRNDQHVMAKFLVSRGAVAEPSEVSQKREEQRIAEKALSTATLIGKMDARRRAHFEHGRRLHPNAVPVCTARRATSP